MRSFLLIILVAVAGLAWGEGEGLREIRYESDVVISERTFWLGGHYLIEGDLLIQPGGELIIKDSVVEIVGSYAREHTLKLEGGLLVTENTTIGGTLREGVIAHTVFELNQGTWRATDTTIRYSYGITFGWEKPGARLRATRLRQGPSPDSVILTGYGDAIIKDSEFSIALNVFATGGRGVLDLPVSEPLDRTFDASNLPGAQYRCRLERVKVPLWFLFVNWLASEGPETELVLRDCPSLIPALSGGDLVGEAWLPCKWNPPASGEPMPLVTPNTSLKVAKVTFRTEDKPAGIGTWGVYLYGPKTDFTLRGPTLVCELFVFEGKVALVGDEGTYNASTTATTVDVGRKGTLGEASLLLKNATVGRFDAGLGIIGQVGAYGKGQVRLERCKLGNLLLLTEDEGRIEGQELVLEGKLSVQPNGGAISLPEGPAVGGDLPL